MAIYAVRKESDTNERLSKRFKRQFQRARVLQEVRERRYFSRPKKKRRIRQEAVKRHQFRQENERKRFYE